MDPTRRIQIVENESNKKNRIQTNTRQSLESIGNGNYFHCIQLYYYYMNQKKKEEEATEKDY